jgi:hypothetical protein
MGQLHKLILSCSVTLFSFAVPTTARPQTYCALTVQVVAPNGRHPEASVEVLEKSGRKIEKDQPPGGVARFCDLGILPVTVTVGLKDCEVVVRDVYLKWREPYTLNVSYDPENCMDEALPSSLPNCKFLIRVNDSKSEWISGAVLRFEDSQRSSITTDKWGRVFFVVRTGTELRGSVTADGFVSQDFSVGCYKVGTQEKYLTLSKK